jgi:transcriptional regulator with XRE-family HTH domain
MTTQFDELMQDPEFRKLYAIESLLGDAAQMVADLLDRRKMKKADLAKLLNKTPAYVSQLLNGRANMTVHTLAEVASALNATVKIEANDVCNEHNEVSSHPHARVFHFSPMQMPQVPQDMFQFEDFSSNTSQAPHDNISEPRTECVA